MYYEKYPMEKYKFYTDNKSVVIAVYRDSRKTYRGVAKCSPEDTFDLEIGRLIAADKCNIAVKKAQLRENTKIRDTFDSLIAHYLSKSNQYNLFIEQNERDIAASENRIREYVKNT